MRFVVLAMVAWILVVAAPAVAESPLTIRRVGEVRSGGQYLLGVELNPVHARQMVTFDERGMATAFDLATGSPIWQSDVAGDHRLSYQTAYATAFSTSGRLLGVSNHFASFAVLVDGASGEILRGMDLPDGFQGCRTLVFSLDERYLACGDWSNFDVVVWETETGRIAKVLPFAANPQWEMRFSADQRLFYQVGFSEVAVWDLSTQEMIGEIAPPRVSPLGGASVIKGGILSPDGRFAALSLFGYDQNGEGEWGFSIVNLETGVAIRTFPVSGPAYAVNFVGNEVQVFLHAELRVYDVPTGTMVSSGPVPDWFDGFLWIADTPVPLRIAPALDFLYTPDGDGVMRIWEITR